MKRVEPERPALPGDDAGVATEEISQRGSHYPATQRGRHNFWKSNAPTVKQIMDKVKKVSRLKKKKRVGLTVIIN